MSGDPQADLDWREVRALRAMTSQPVARLRHVTVERLEAVLSSSREDAVRVMELLASKGLARCHRDADDGCVCCASVTERGSAVAAGRAQRLPASQAG
jgi:hypothetical protein